MSQLTPFIEIVLASRGGGYRVGFNEVPGLHATGPTVMAALKALSEDITQQYSTEKGDETAATQDAMHQADILSNDRFIRGGQLQNSVLMAMACGFF